MSHSAIPTCSPVLAVVAAGELAGTGVLVLVGATAFLFVSVEGAQANTNKPVRIHDIRRRDFDILFLPVQEWQSAPIIH